MGSENATLYDYHKEVKVLIFQIVAPMIFIPGAIGNILSIHILRRPEILHLPTTPYLISLAIADLLALLLPLLRAWMMYVSPFDIRTTDDSVCKIHLYLSYVATFCSFWIQAAVNVDRCIYVKFPLAWNKIRLRHRVATILAILLFFLLIDIHILIYFKLTQCPRKPRIGCYYNITDPVYTHFISFIWTWIDFALGFLIPFVVMVICSVIMVKYLWTVKVKNSDVTINSPKDIARKTTKLLISLNIVFFISVLPKRVNSIIRPHLPRDDKSLARMYAYTIVYLLMYVNHAVNFLLYVFQGPRYREALKNTFRCSKKGQPDAFGEDGASGKEAVTMHSITHTDNVAMRNVVKDKTVGTNVGGDMENIAMGSAIMTDTHSE